MKSRAWFVLIGFFLLTIGSRPIQTAIDEVLPAGTTLNVRTSQPIEAEYSQVGTTFPAIVDDPVTVNGRIVIPRGSSAMLEAVRVERSSNLKGRDRITLRVRSLQVGGHAYPVATSYVELKGRSEGKRAARKIGGGAGVGAAVGGLLGGGAGAAAGAAAGGTAGAVVAGSGKKHLLIPAETQLQFRLDAPVRIRR